MYFTDGRVREFPTATVAHNRKGLFLIVREDESTCDVEALEIFDSSGVSAAEVYEDGVLATVVAGDGPVAANV